jgi:hypothetical protein
MWPAINNLQGHRLAWPTKTSIFHFVALDACVYCDCFERGRLVNPPPFGIEPMLDKDGSLSFETADDSLWVTFENWRSSEACEHARMKLVDHRLGNIALVALLRAELSRDAESYPLLLGNVLYNGIHCGDFLPLEILPEVRDEVDRISRHMVEKSNLLRRLQNIWPSIGRGSRWQAPSERTSLYLQYFQKQMIELIDAAMIVGKPICF